MIKIIKIILVISCMVTIFILSNDTAEKSSKKSSKLIVNIGETLTRKKFTEKEKKKYIKKYSHLVRKTAHLIAYLVLGFLIASLLSEYMAINKRLIVISILLTMSYSILDEIHQTFIVGRSGEIKDVIIDTLGGVVGTYLYYFYFLLFK